MVEICFATNRILERDDQGQSIFGERAIPAEARIVFGTATVEGSGLDDPDSYKVTSCTITESRDLDVGLTAKLLAGDKDVLVFVHGAANAFASALQRAAFNVNWLNQQDGRGFNVLMFSWPSRYYQIWNIVDAFQDYKRDQEEAEASAWHVVQFLQALKLLRTRFRRRGMALLAHSMGNFVLGFGVEGWFSEPRSGIIFDSAVLAAPDEPFNTFNYSHGRRLSDFWQITRDISVYFSQNDIMMDLSLMVNSELRLGDKGPPNHADTSFFPVEQYQFVDCAKVNDYTYFSFDQSHQYYRQSETVRRDIGRVLRGLDTSGATRVYDLMENVYRLTTAGV